MWIADYFVGTVTLIVLLVASRSSDIWLFRLLAMRPLAAIGVFAYSIYLIHAPLLQVIWQYVAYPLHLSNAWTFLVLTAFGGPIIVGCAYLFYLSFERPFVNKARHKGPI
jgi:peptidoglycan/LPS O-acetylase OafA/YrhL